MDNAVKQRWLKALRSGDYEQGKNHLCYNDKYCCLGVLADIEDLFDPQLDGQSRFVNAGFGKRLFGMLSAEYIRSIDMCYVTAGELAIINDESDDFKEVINMIEAL